MAQYKGASRQHEIAAARRRKDSRRFGQRWRELLDSSDGVMLGVVGLPVLGVLSLGVPGSGELLLLVAWWFFRRVIRVDRRAWDFPYRAPAHAMLRDGSLKGGKSLGEGITYLGHDLETRDQIYASNADLRAHMLVLGTTGSGKTEFLLGLVANALVQNTGFIYVDGKGDPKLQKEVFRLARTFGREDDLLLVNFITSGRDFVETQPDKVTNTINLMANTSSGMLIELIVALMDDSGGGGDMWKGRAISFVAALTRPLVYLRDKGFLNLSPDKYIEHFELHVLEELVWEHNGRYGELFDVIVAPLRSYLTTLPGYQKAKAKKQEQKTLEQHGFIVMQLTRIFNDLSFNYGHIFRSRGGADVDFYDVVTNRRLLVVLLPALERAPDSLRMLGKMIVGSIKQMMAGCLGNRVEGQIREIIESRPTNAPVPFNVILDEYGYYAVIGFAVAPAQARSLGFAMVFAAQDFSSLKKSSAEEADATWENTTIRAVGRITSGKESETWRRISGAAGESQEAVLQGFERKFGAVNERLTQQDSVGIERRDRLDYDDLAMQENGEFTFIVGKKERGGLTGGVRVIRGMGFYTAGPTPKEMRLNDLLPIEAPEPADLPVARRGAERLLRALNEGTFQSDVRAHLVANPVLTGLREVFERYEGGPAVPRLRLAAAQIAVSWFLDGAKPLPAAARAAPGPAPAVEPALVDTSNLMDEMLDQVLMSACAEIVRSPESFVTAAPLREDVVLAPAPKTTDLLNAVDEASWQGRARSILSSTVLFVDATRDWEEQVGIAGSEQLLTLELMARGTPFESLEAKWQAEDTIAQTQGAVAAATVYPAPPEPAPVDVDTARQTLAALASKCERLVAATRSPATKGKE